MKPISGLVELPEKGQLQKRINFLSENSAGLGPADLLILTKKSSQGNIITYSYFSGLSFRKESDIKDFVTNLKSRRPHKLLRQLQYELTKVDLCIWNPFSKTDFRIQVDDKKNVTINCYNASNEHIDFNQQLFDEITIASTLRYWIPYDQLYRSIFNLPYTDSYPLNVQTPKLLTNDELTYISDNLNSSADLDFALAAFLLANFNSNDFINTVNVLKTKFPGVIASILRFIPLSSPLADKLYDFLLHSFSKYPDNPLIIKTVIEMASMKKDKQITHQIMSVIKNTSWSNPTTCISFAKTYICLKKFEEAKVITNGTFYCREYQEPQNLKFNPELPESPSNSAPRSVPRSIEKEIIESQLDMTSDLIYHVVFELRESYGVMRLKDAKNYPQPKNGIIKDQNYQGNTNLSIESSNNDEDLDNLFDPGVSSFPSVPTIFYRLPFSSYFFDVLEVIDHESDEVSKLKRNGSVSSQQDARRAAVLALKTGDQETLRIALNFFESKKRYRPVHFLIQMAVFARNGGDVPVYKDPKLRWTLAERNALDVIVPISQNLPSLLSR